MNASLQERYMKMTFDVNSKCEIDFDPEDSTFAQDMLDCFMKLDESQEVYEKKVCACSTFPALFEVFREYDANARRAIDKTIGKPVCDSLFGDMNVYAFGNGLPVWSNFLLAIMLRLKHPAIADFFSCNERAKKYMNRFDAYSERK